MAALYRKEVEVITSGLNDYVLDKKVLRLLNSILLQIFYHSIALGIEIPEKRHFLKKNRAGLLDVRLVKKSNGGFYLTIRNDGAGIDLGQVRASVDDSIYAEDASRTNKKQLLAMLLCSCNPRENKPLSYGGDLLCGDELLTLFEKIGVTFDVRSVTDEGSVFEFVFPSPYSS